MTIPVSQIVNVAITRQTQVPQGPGFGTLLIVGPDSTGVIPLAERIRFYSSIEGVAADFASTDEEYRAASSYFAQNPTPTRVAIGVRDEAETIADEMDAISDVDDDWYGVMLTQEGRTPDPDAAALAAWVESRRRLHLTVTEEADAIAAGGGLAATLKASNYVRSGIFYQPSTTPDGPENYPEAAFFGRMLTVDFNGINTTRTGKFKTLAGIPTVDLTQNELEFLVGTSLDPTNGHNGNVHSSAAGHSMVFNGIMSGGEWFDIMHFVDWLEAEIQFRVFGKLAVENKIPYSNAGMEMIANEVRLALQQGVTNGGIASQFDDNGDLIDAFSVTVPNIRSASQADRSARKAPPISFTARLAGAIHYVQVNGTVTV